MKVAVRTGLSVTEFNELTPYEFKIIVDDFMQKEKERAERELSIAYTTAYFHRVERLEPLDTYRKQMNGETKKKAMTSEEMLQKVMELNAKMGGSAPAK